MSDPKPNARGGERHSSNRSSDRSSDRSNDRASEHSGQHSSHSGRETAHADADRPSAAPLMSRIGNQGMQILLQPLLPAGAIAPEKHAAGGATGVAPTPPSDGEPAGAAEIKRTMGHRYGQDFSNVRLRTDAAAARQARTAGARAYTQGDEIGFAHGVYDASSRAGRLTLAHEFAHIAQRRGGNVGDALPAMPNAAMAERQAARAASAVERGGQPRVSAYGGRETLYDDGKSEIGLQSDEDKLLFDTVTKMLETLPDGAQRQGMIVFLVGLAMKPGPVNGDATQRLIDVLKGEPVKNFSDHFYAVGALKEWLSKDAYRVYDFLLYGRFYFADHSKNEIGSELVQGAFQRWLEDGKGTWCIAYLKRKINGQDPLQANLAARIVADLLEREGTPDTKKHQANYAALRSMARENGWESFGALGRASATPRIFSALAAMRQEAVVMERTVRLGPISDPFEDTDIGLLNGIIGGLNARGDLSRPSASGDPIRIFTAENREETEHALLSKSTQATTDWLQDMAKAYTIAADAGAKIQARIEALHQNAEALDQFLGSEAASVSDERLALFDLRHEYIVEWLSITGTTFGGGSFGLAASYQARLDMVDRKFEEFDQVLAVRKFKTTRERFKEYSRIWNDGVEAYSNASGLANQFYFDMKRTLAAERESIADRMATGFSTNMGGVTVRLAPSDDYIPTDLRMVSRLAQDTSLFGLQSALFLVYASSLSVESMMLKADVGSSAFQRKQSKRLTDMRVELRGFWDSAEFEKFIAKTGEYESALKEVVNEIKDRAKLDLLINLAITLVAALATSGAALAVRVAAVSETIALARTARAISSASLLFEAGVFTASELTMRSLVFGKDITAAGAIKSAATNLAFMGAMKLVGKFAEPLAKGSRLRQLAMGHLVGFAGVSAVSATLTRIETGQWPEDTAFFLAQTAATYLLIAGVQHGFNTLIATPALETAARARLQSLKTSNEALYRTLREKVDSGNLTVAEFEALKAERIRLLEETKAIAKVLKEGGAINAAELAAIEKMAGGAMANATGATFPLASTGAVEPTIKALPAPDSVIELTRVGDTDTYYYDPSKSSVNIDAMLTRYTEKGFTVEGNSGLRRVVDPTGRTRFLLTGTPIASPRLLPEGKPGPGMESLGQLERATGLSGPALQPIRDALARVHPELEAKVKAQSAQERDAIRTLSIFAQYSGTLQPGWSTNAVFGVIEAAKFENAIPNSAIHRLFLSVDPAKLPKLFSDYYDISNSKKVKGIAPYVIADDLLPKNSLLLISAARELQAAGVELPTEMDLRSSRGLLRQVEKMPGGWKAWLMAIATTKRLESLRAASGLVDPRVTMPTNVTELLAEISADLRPGLSPLNGTDGEAFVKELEAQTGAGKFADAGQRFRFVALVDKLRTHVSLLQQGMNLEHGKWENIVGDANEVRQIATTLLRGYTIEGIDQNAGPKAPLPNVDLRDVPLPGGGKVLNATDQNEVHIDLLLSDAAGNLIAMELTTKELGLPQEFAALDPQNSAYGSDIDWQTAEANKSKANVRKFMQMVKIYQLNKVAVGLASAWSGKAVNPASMRIRAGDFTVPAARAIEALGFVMELNDGTVQTAAQIEARKKTR